MRALALVSVLCAVAAAAVETWHADTACWHTTHIAAADDSSSFFLLGRVNNDGEACIERWTVGAKKSTWSRIYTPKKPTGTSGFTSVIHAKNGDLVVGGYYQYEDEEELVHTVGVVSQISAATGDVVWRQERVEVVDYGAGTNVVGFLAGGDILLAMDNYGGGSHTYVAWLDPASGAEISRAWMDLMGTFAVLSPDLGTLLTVPPATDGRLFAWDANNVTTGQIKPKYHFGGKFVTLEPVLRGSAAALSGGCAWVAEESGGLGTALMGCDSPIPVWQNMSSMATSVAESAKIVISADLSNSATATMDQWIVGLHAQDSTTGDTVWYTELPLPANFPDGLVFSDDGSALYVICSSWNDFHEQVFRLDAATGKVEWHTEFSDIGSMYGPILVASSSGERDVLVVFGINDLWAVMQ